MELRVLKLTKFLGHVYKYDDTIDSATCAKAPGVSVDALISNHNVELVGTSPLGMALDGPRDRNLEEKVSRLEAKIDRLVKVIEVVASSKLGKAAAQKVLAKSTNPDVTSVVNNTPLGKDAAKPVSVRTNALFKNGDVIKFTIGTGQLKTGRIKTVNKSTKVITAMSGGKKILVGFDKVVA